MKRSILIALMTLVALAGLANAQSDPSVTGTLVIYTTTYDIEYKLIIEQGFQGKYPNVKVESVQAGAGELKTRIRSEAANPQADVMFGGL
ncbi:MAG TPA: hypothetical protein PKN52_02390, partial [Trueperaceae bacterium]|nr:hypothetical protein [Trueperaceae bacterium]